MKRLTRLLAILAVAAIVLAIAPTPAEAACGTPVGFGNVGAYNYTTAPAPASINTSGGSQRIGRFWEPGKRAAAAGAGQDEGSCDESLSCGNLTGAEGWWRSFGTVWYINGQMDIAAVDGCPGVPGDGDTTPPDEMIIVLLDATDPPVGPASDAYYYALRPSYNIADAKEFNISDTNPCPQWEDATLIPIPRPGVSSSTRTGPTTVNLNLTFADVAPGFQGFDLACAAKSPYATITGYNICQVEGPADPGRLATSWTCAPGPATGPGGATQTAFPVTCTGGGAGNPNDRFIATQLRFNGGPGLGGYDSEYVSRSTRLECDPNLAQPEDELQTRPGRRPATQRPSGKAPRLP